MVIGQTFGGMENMVQAEAVSDKGKKKKVTSKKVTVKAKKVEPLLTLTDF